jgi:ligand-binding SRPBCC domain-containing protein
MQVTESIAIRCAPERAFRFCLSIDGFEAHFPLATRWISQERYWSAGSIVDFKFKMWGLWLRYVAQVTECIDNRLFVDVMKRGPYKYRIHKHLFEPTADGMLYTDIVDFSAGMFGIADRILLLLERRNLKRRHAMLQRALEAS